MKQSLVQRGAQRCPCQCHWDLSWLRFGNTRISFTDVDGLFVVERSGHFLFLETKRSDEELTMGQRILLEALSSLPKFTVILLRGPRGHPQSLQRIRQGVWNEEEPCNREEFQRRLNGWFCTVN